MLKHAKNGNKMQIFIVSSAGNGVTLYSKVEKKPRLALSSH